MELVTLVIVIVSAVCLFLAAFNVTVARPNLGWFGLALYVTAVIVGRLV